MLVMFTSVTAFGQTDPSVQSQETFTRLYRAAPLACRAPQCMAVSQPRRLPASMAQYQEANRFLIAGARACIVDCTCTVQGGVQPGYCGLTAAAPAAAPAPTTVATTTEVTATTPAPAAEQTPAVTAVQPPMPQNMFSMFGLGGMTSTTSGSVSGTTGTQSICSGTADTLATLGQLNSMGAGLTAGSSLQWFDATWQMTTARMDRRMPNTISFHVSPSPYAMVVSLRYAVMTPNGIRNYVKEVVPFNNGMPVLHQAVRQTGGTCARGAIPPNVNADFHMQWEGMSTNFELEVTCYHVTPASRPVAGPVSGIVLGTPVRGGTIRRTFTSSDGLVPGRIYNLGCGL